MSAARPRIAVYGSSTIAPDSAAYRLAYDLGAELGRLGAAVMTGGYSGVMEAASRGAHEAGGHVIGVTVETYASRGPANAWIMERIHTPDLLERLRVLTHTARGFVVTSPSLGTLTELHLTWTLIASHALPPASLVLLGDGPKRYVDALRLDEWLTPDQERCLSFARTPAEAARLALAGAAERSVS